MIMSDVDLLKIEICKLQYRVEQVEEKLVRVHKKLRAREFQILKKMGVTPRIWKNEVLSQKSRHGVIPIGGALAAKPILDVFLHGWGEVMAERVKKQQNPQ